MTFIEFIVTQSIWFYILWLATSLLGWPFFSTICYRVIGSEKVGEIITSMYFPVIYFTIWFAYMTSGMSFAGKIEVFIYGSPF